MFRVTIAQFTPKLGNKSANIKNMINMMKKAKEQQSQLIVFPELCLTGYFISESLSELAEPLSGKSIQTLQTACKEHGIYAVISFPEKHLNGTFYIAAALIDDKGSIKGIYRKSHLFANEGDVFSSGTELPVFDTELGKMAIMICYDLEFPEVARILRLKGAQLLLVPLANMQPYEKYQFIYLQSRAMENQIPIVLCNRTGTENDTHFFGESAIVSSDGSLLIKLNDEEQLQTIHVPLNEQLDEQLSYMKDRRTDLYAELLDKTS
ncbi:carbon-nitrogen hydrolase family protein [Heyndrickxia ginsengihumi]|uniref:Carbon-nitrogen hydrolase n=1 Tax=Heyndrickxia ginsengihumi TaxID=363870 RepID=A0A0A6VEE7_9BACI|nr:carbon-nitrogen hydrolase family protein [Heyndrickxia ginsengihumi]KHD85833.1 carbon-nitrogen hydrolase [Heyndrickxia ginsengihumi]MBE6184829.1 carbon-nitrogen hydrolase family protein [Bacillus sp. (in: firmicutes)]MCM3023998.1 carbon-nitrogen hydrolase family protein [Heyndrickxia ginsengihumi]